MYGLLPIGRNMYGRLPIGRNMYGRLPIGRTLWSRPSFGSSLCSFHLHLRNKQTRYYKNHWINWHWYFLSRVWSVSVYHFKALRNLNYSTMKTTRRGTAGDSNPWCWATREWQDFSDCQYMASTWSLQVHGRTRVGRTSKAWAVVKRATRRLVEVVRLRA